MALDAQARAVGSETPSDMRTAAVSHAVSLCFSLNSSSRGEKETSRETVARGDPAEGWVCRECGLPS